MLRMKHMIELGAKNPQRRSAAVRNLKLFLALGASLVAPLASAGEALKLPYRVRA